VTEVKEAFARSDRLAEISESSALALLRALGWTGLTCRSSDMTARPGRSQHLADLAAAAGAASYLCGTGGARYLDPAPFAAGGICVTYFRPPQPPGRPAPGHRATALGDLAASGPGQLSGQLAEHAQCWRVPRQAA
jgi:WbqC-like protein family